MVFLVLLFISDYFYFLSEFHGFYRFSLRVIAECHICLLWTFKTSELWKSEKPLQSPRRRDTGRSTIRSPLGVPLVPLVSGRQYREREPPCISRSKVYYFHVTPLPHLLHPRDLKLVHDTVPHPIPRIRSSSEELQKLVDVFSIIFFPFPVNTHARSF